MYNDEGGGPLPSTTLTVLNNQLKGVTKTAFLLKDALIDLTQQRLPSRIGNKYAEIVVTYLTCLDRSNTDFSDRAEFEDTDSVLIGVRYIEKVRHCVITSLYPQQDPLIHTDSTLT